MLKQYRAEEIRYFILNSHYRSPLNYSPEPLDAAQAALTRMYTALRGLPEVEAPEGTEQEQRFHAAMEDDFNTSGAIAILFELAREINRLRKADQPTAATQYGALLRKLGGMLGLLENAAEDWFKGRANSNSLSDDDIEQMIQQRTAARAQKDWATCDRIRDTLKEKGIVLEDGPGGTRWRRV